MFQGVTAVGDSLLLLQTPNTKNKCIWNCIGYVLEDCSGLGLFAACNAFIYFLGGCAPRQDTCTLCVLD